MSDDTKLVPISEQPDYETLIADVRAIINAGQGRVLATINQEQVVTYWRIGERIVQEEQRGAERAAYGEQLMERLGRELTEEYGRGWGKRSLQYMRQFYLAYPIVHSVSAQLTWTHYRILLRIDDEPIRAFYADLAAKARWSVRELERQMNSQLHLRAALSRKKEELAKTLPRNAPASTIAEAFKDPYILDFLGLEDTYSEKNLEAALIRNIERFLLELGDGFCFVGRQQRITVDGEDYYIDLVFYHRHLRCLVLVDLKIGKFDPADIAQMQLYLEWTKRNNKAKGEKDPIGLILCGSHGEQVVELLEANQKKKRVKVAQYLPLKDVEAIKAHLAKMSQAYEQLQAGKEQRGEEAQP